MADARIKIIVIYFIFKIRMKLSILAIKTQKRIWKMYNLKKVYLLIDKLNCPKAKCIRLKFMKIYLII